MFAVQENEFKCDVIHILEKIVFFGNYRCIVVGKTFCLCICLADVWTVIKSWKDDYKDVGFEIFKRESWYSEGEY